MKHLAICAVLMTFLGAHCVKAQKKEFKEKIKKELSFENKNDDNLLVVKNINGFITMEGYDGDVILLEVEKIISAKNLKDLELGKKEIGIKIIQDPNKIFVHVQAPFITMGEDEEIRYMDCNVDLKYDFILNFTLKVPYITNLEVTTVNEGGILVENTKGNSIEANNINGGITLNNITGQTEVHAINGEVSISYAANPKGPSTYFSLNGDINITYQEDLSAEIAFKSMNGELFTDFDIVGQYAKTNKNESGKGSKGKYEYESKPIVQIGKGALFHDFETLNGNVVIRKI